MNAAHPRFVAAVRRCATLSMLALGSLLVACGGGAQPEPPKPVLDEAAMRLRMMSASPAASAPDAGARTAPGAGSVYTLKPTLAWATADGRVLVCSAADAEGTGAGAGAGGPSGCEIWSPSDGLHVGISDAGAQALLAGASALGSSSPSSARYTFAATGAVAPAALPDTRFMALPVAASDGAPAVLWPAAAAPGEWLLFGTDAAGRPTAASRVQVQATTPAA